jgi:hypothetical protein
MFGLVLGRPGRRVFEPAYFLATSRRYHRRMVSGVTMPAMSARRRRPRTLPFTAKRRRWSSDAVGMRREDRFDGSAVLMGHYASKNFEPPAVGWRMMRAINGR